MLGAQASACAGSRTMDSAPKALATFLTLAAVGLLTGAVTQSGDASVVYTHEKSVDQLLGLTAIFALCSVVFWTLDLAGVFGTDAGLYSGGFFAMGILVILPFSCGALIRAYDFSSESQILLAMQLSLAALGLVTFVASFFSHGSAKDVTVGSDGKAWWFVPFQIVTGTGAPVLTLLALLLGEMDADTLPTNLAIASTVSGFVSMLLFYYYFYIRRESGEKPLPLLWFSILVDVASALTAGFSCGYLLQMGQYASAGYPDLAVWLLAATLVVKLVQWVVSHACAPGIKEKGN